MVEIDIWRPIMQRYHDTTWPLERLSAFLYGGISNGVFEGPPMVATRLRVSMVRWLEESGFMQKKCWRQNGTPKYGDVTGSIARDHG